MKKRTVEVTVGVGDTIYRVVKKDKGDQEEIVTNRVDEVRILENRIDYVVKGYSDHSYSEKDFFVTEERARKYIVDKQIDQAKRAIRELAIFLKNSRSLSKDLYRKILIEDLADLPPGG